MQTSVADNRTSGRPYRVSSAKLRRLDGFFGALGDVDSCRIISAVCEGSVTGADLADALNQPREKVSRYLNVLERAGIVEKRRDGRWVRATPLLSGVVSAQTWIGALRAKPSAVASPAARPVSLDMRAQLKDRSRRSLLTQISSTPEATQAQLVRACGLSQPVASRGLAALLKSGFVEVKRDDGSARYIVREEAIESLWLWMQNAKAKLTLGRETASQVVLPAPRGAKSPTAADDASPPPAASPLPATLQEADAGGGDLSSGPDREDDGVAPPAAAEGPRHDHGSTDTADDGAIRPVAGGDRQALEAPAIAVSDADSSAQIRPHEPDHRRSTPPEVAPARTPPPRATSSLQAPRPRITEVSQSLEADALRGGQCFLCNDGAIILLISSLYGEMKYARNVPGQAEITFGREGCSRLALRLKRAIDPSAFPRERIPLAEARAF